VLISIVHAEKSAANVVVSPFLLSSPPSFLFIDDVSFFLVDTVKIFPMSYVSFCSFSSVCANSVVGFFLFS
jgi:hypothetical protein